MAGAGPTHHYGQPSGPIFTGSKVGLANHGQSDEKASTMKSRHCAPLQDVGSVLSGWSTTRLAGRDHVAEPDRAPVRSTAVR